MNEYIFPFDTCEKKQDIIAQPYSVFVNILNCLIIIYYLNKAKTNHSKYLLLSFLLFESLHTIAHAVHIKSSIQSNLTHLSSYFVNIFLLYYFYKQTNIKPTNEFIAILLIILLFDFYFVHKSMTINFIGTQTAIFLLILIYYYTNMPIKIKNNIHKIIFLAGCVMLLLINEKLNCKKMLNKYPNFPFHCLIEIIGLYLFYILCNGFYDL
jgi:hypothetical protein